MVKNPEEKLVEVNELLGKQPSIGLLPANQILPIAVIIMICYTVIEGFLSLGYIWVIFSSLWLIATWILLTGNNPDQYLNKFRQPIFSNWTIGGTVYISPLLTKKRRLKLHQELEKERNRRKK